MFSFFTASLGALSMSFGLFLSPIIIGICKRKSTRLTAVIGGLVLSLGCLFSSFANQFHQLYFSHAVMTGKKWLSRTACCALLSISRLKNGKFLYLCLLTISIAPLLRPAAVLCIWRRISKCLRLNDDALTPRPRSGTNARHLNSNGGPIFQKEAGNRRNVSGRCLWPRYFHYVHFSLQSYQVRQSNHL